MKRENTMIGGLSMGGYGAIHTALMYPEKYSACIALSSALVVRDVANAPDSEVGGVLPAGFREELFGDPSKLIDSDKNPEVLYRRIKEQGKEAPFMYIAIGTEDNLLPSNRLFRDFLEDEGATFFYEEGPGAHTWQFWNEYIDRGLKKVIERRF